MTKEWPLYRGTKVLKAKPMTKGEYNQFRGWPHPADEDADELGYVVEYQDGGKPNVEGFDGYVSWSPADVFERTYHLIEQENVLGTGATSWLDDAISRRNAALTLAHHPDQTPEQVTIRASAYVKFMEGS